MEPKKKRRCIRNTEDLLKQITGNPPLLTKTEVNKIRLSLFTERKSDGTGWLILRGNDLQQRFHMRVQDSDMRALTSYCKELPRAITKLDLSYNCITDRGFRHLFMHLLILGKSSILNLNIMHNRLTEESILRLANYSKFIKLKHLKMNGIDMGTKGGQYLATFLTNNSSVEYLDIGETGQTLTSVAAIITALRIDHGGNQTVKVLDFNRIIPLFNRYSVETRWLAYHIEYLLERNSSIIELHLQKNELIGHDVEYIVRGLKSNSTLQYLDLGYNRIGDYGAELLGIYLKEGSNLVVLNIAGNDIKDGKALSVGLAFAKKIRGLDLSKNKMTELDLIAILNTIKVPNYMKFLNIWGNNLGDKCCRLIKLMMDTGILLQNMVDVKIYEVDGVLHAAYYPNPSDRSKHIYYCELDSAQVKPILHIKRNLVDKPSFNVQAKRYSIPQFKLY